MKRKKRTAALPRVTVLAYRRQDLVEFVQAVENLRLLVNDLRAVVEELKQRTPRSRAKKPAAAEEPHWERVNPNANPADVG